MMRVSYCTVLTPRLAARGVLISAKPTVIASLFTGCTPKSETATSCAGVNSITRVPRTDFTVQRPEAVPVSNFIESVSASQKMPFFTGFKRKVPEVPVLMV